MWTKLNSFMLSLYSRAQIRNEEGQALVEYTLILALVSIVAITILGAIGTDIVGKLTKVSEAL